MDNNQLAENILSLVGANNIVKAYNCMTRLRLEVRSPATESCNELKILPGVKGVIRNDTEIHIVLGPGKAESVTRRINALLRVSSTPPHVEQETLIPFSADSAPKSSIHANNISLLSSIRKKSARSRSKPLLQRVGSIFIPLIPAFIGCGLLTGLLSLLLKISPEIASLPLIQYLKIAGSAVFTVLNAFVGLYTCREFGGTPALGGVLAALLSSPELSHVAFFGESLTPGRGGVFAALLVGGATALAETRLRKILPEMIRLFATPFLTIILISLAALLIFQPAGGFLSDAIGHYTIWAIQSGGAFTGFILGGFFLPVVMAGIHHGLTPIHADLLATQGITILLPIVAMAGCGQVGAALAVYIKSRNNTLKHTILSALPVGLMGIGEPLIYGVTLPLGRPFLAACGGGALGGAWQAMQNTGAYAMGISGLPLAAATNYSFQYLIGVLIAYIGGFMLTWLIGFEDPPEINTVSSSSGPG